MAREVSKWITVNGNHVPIYEGESKADVRKRIEQLGSKSESKKGSSKKSSAKSEEAANKAAKRKTFLEATARLRASETEAHRYRTLKEHDYEELTAAEKKELKQLQKKASKGELDKNKKAPAKKESFDHDKAVEFFAKKEGISKEKAANMVKNLGEEKVKRMMEKGDTKKTEYKSGPSKFDVEDYKKKVASDSDFYAKIAGIKSKKMVEKEKAEAAKETKIDGANTISKEDFVKKYAEEYGMDADDFKQKGKDIKNFIIPEDEENPYIGVEYSDGTFWRYGTGRDLEVTKKELQDSLGKPTQQDKDERVKQKQIANAQKQKDALNGVSSSSNRPSKSLAEKAEDAKENAKLRTELAQEEHFKKQGESSWEPKEGDRVSNVGYNEAKNKLFNAPAGTVIQMSNHNLGDYEGEYTKQADGSWVGSQKYKSNRRTPPTVKTADGFAMQVQGNDVKVLTGGQMKAAKSGIGTSEQKDNIAKSKYGKSWSELQPWQKTQVRNAIKKGSAEKSKYNAENKTPVGHQKWKEVLSDLSTKTHPNDVDYMMAQIDDGKTIDKIHALLGRVDNEEGYPLPGREGLHYKDASPEVKRKIIDLIKSYVNRR